MEKEPYVYIDENANVYKGIQNYDLIQKKVEKERHFFDPHRGVVSVDYPRWQEAQMYEKQTWMVKCRAVISDRNEYHHDRFARYSLLQGLTFEKGIELGCGPFTNMRLILRYCDIKEIYLLDPLINDYLKHPFCQYRKGYINSFRNIFTLSAFRYPLSFMRSIIYNRMGFYKKKVNIVNSMIETYQTNLSFDLVVMINVLEHCQDADAVFTKIIDILSPNGIFVFADKMYKSEDVKRLSTVLYDAGHPLRVDRTVIEEFLNKNFKPLLRADYFIEQEFYGVHLNYQERYFIGRKFSVKEQ